MRATLVALIGLLAGLRLVAPVQLETLLDQQVYSKLSKLEYESRGLALGDRCDAFVAYLRQALNGAPMGRAQLMSSAIEALEARNANRASRPLALNVLRECLLSDPKSESAASLQAPVQALVEPEQSRATKREQAAQVGALESTSQAAEIEQLRRDSAQLLRELNETRQELSRAKVKLLDALSVANQERDQCRSELQEARQREQAEKGVEQLGNNVKLGREIDVLRGERDACNGALKEVNSKLNREISNKDELKFNYKRVCRELDRAKLESDRQKSSASDLQSRLELAEQDLKKMRQIEAAREAEAAEIRAAKSRQEQLEQSRKAEEELARRQMEQRARKRRESNEIEVEFVNTHPMPWHGHQFGHPAYAPRYPYY